MSHPLYIIVVYDGALDILPLRDRLLSDILYAVARHLRSVHALAISDCLPGALVVWPLFLAGRTICSIYSWLTIIIVCRSCFPVSCFNA